MLSGEMGREEAGRLLDAIRGSIGQVIVGKAEVVDLVLVALLAGGHVLIEDVPGLGKTTLVSALCQSLSCSFSRIQFTPDVTPSDLTGFTAFHLKSGEQEYHRGAVMSQIVLADEINRTSPKTQSALLQAMQEGAVTVDGITHPLPRPFMVLATQNPAELTGTYPLPEAQLDRFLLRIAMGYPSRTEEVEILEQHRTHLSQQPLSAVVDSGQVLQLQQLAGSVRCALPILNYIAELVERTRSHRALSLGISPRGSIALMRAAMARALLQGRDYVTPDDVQELAVPALCHRMILSPQAGLQNQTARSVLEEILSKTAVPAVRAQR